MKILIGQPKLETTIMQLEEALRKHHDIDIVIFPEGYLNDNLSQACELARFYETTIMTGYKKPKDRAVIISSHGDVLLDRSKYDEKVVVDERGLRLTHLLCDEIVLQGLSEDIKNIDLIAHPIGVGMFSEDQFEEWIGLAKKIAKVHRGMIIGASHADGSFRGSEVSIPIAYCIDSEGNDVFVMKNDTRTVLLDTETMSYSIEG